MEKLQQDMEKGLTIQEMAEITGLSAHTLRYYERAGLMRQQVGRDDSSGYRAYTQQHVSWIAFIKRLRATGMPIRDIQRYTELLREGEHTIPERMQLLRQHQSRVEEHLRETEQHLTAITTKIARYEQEYARGQSVHCDETCIPIHPHQPDEQQNMLDQPVEGDETPTVHKQLAALSRQ
jgi:DNA-binding transcriptional MerR regulator